MIKPSGKMEKRAFDACQSIQRGELSCFAVYWAKSSMWGLCPRIEYRGEKAAHASGCGYDKLSAVVVDFLRWLVPDDDAFLAGCSGAGVRTVQDKLKLAGWVLRHDYDGKTEDGFSIERAASVEPSAQA